MYESKKKYNYGTGRRKSSVARVRVYENGTGSIIINGRDIVVHLSSPSADHYILVLYPGSPYDFRDFLTAI